MTPTIEARVDHLDVSAFVVPTDAPESDGTLQWDKTTLVVVEVAAGACRGLGYTYADSATAKFIDETLRNLVLGAQTMNVAATWREMVGHVRNLGRAGVASMAISAVDCALWDLKARLLDLPLVTLLGALRPRAELYGSGGFTSYDSDRLRAQLGEWAASGMGHVKMKVGRQPRRDIERVREARDAIGRDVELFVDANGAYSRKQALAMADVFAVEDVSWFEEPVSADDLDGLRLLRDRVPPGMIIAAGEYGYDAFYFRRMLEAGAVDVLQADGSRCGGITGLLQADALCFGHGIPLSLHCAPQLHAHVACALQRFIHLEYFHDHQRIERMMFDGALTPKDGALAPDLSRPGMGLELRRSDAMRFAI